MTKLSLGLIETLGIVPAIEAADTALKASSVELLGYELVTGGLVTVKFVGSVADVQVAVDAGKAAAARVGTVISSHVIPRPDESVEILVGTPGAGDPPRIEPQELHQNHQELGAMPQGADDPPRIERQGLREHEELEQMPVVELRRLARKTPGISISGREISRANKEVLIKELLRAFNETGG